MFDGFGKYFVEISLCQGGCRSEFSGFVQQLRRLFQLSGFFQRGAKPGQDVRIVRTDFHYGSIALNSFIGSSDFSKKIAKCRMPIRELRMKCDDCFQRVDRLLELADTL